MSLLFLFCSTNWNFIDANWKFFFCLSYPSVYQLTHLCSYNRLASLGLESIEAKRSRLSVSSDENEGTDGLNKVTAALAEKTAVKMDKTTVVRRLLLNQMQLIGLVGQFNLNWPDLVSKAFAATDSVASFSPVNGGFGSALNCLVRPHNIVIPVFNVFTSIGLIVISSGLVTVFWIIIHPCLSKRKKRKVISPKEQRKRRHDNVYVSVIILFYMMYSSLARVGFGLFSCELFQVIQYNTIVVQDKYIFRLLRKWCYFIYKQANTTNIYLQADNSIMFRLSYTPDCRPCLNP